MQTLELILAGHPFFEGLEQPYLDLITSCAANVRFETGEYLLREGESADRFYLLRHGSVALETYAPQRGPITIETIEAGEVLGWSWLFPPFRWHFDARALEPVRALALDGACLRGKIETLWPPIMEDGANAPARKFTWRFRETSMLVWFLTEAHARRPAE